MKERRHRNRKYGRWAVVCLTISLVSCIIFLETTICIITKYRDLSKYNHLEKFVLMFTAIS